MPLALASGTESDSVAFMPMTFDQALSTLRAARSVRLRGKPAAWSNALRVMFYILIVMVLTPSGVYHVNHLLAPELRPRISPPMGPVWNRHHRYIYVPGVGGLKEAEVIRLINTGREMFGAPAPAVQQLRSGSRGRG